MGLSFIPFSFPGLDKVRCAFQTRNRGFSNGSFARGNISFDVGDDPECVRRNRAELKRGLGFEDWCELKQVHGTDMVFEPEPVGVEEPGQRDGDGMAVSRRGAALIIKTADCQPVLLAHEQGGHIAALHAGWRGCRQGFPLAGVKEFCERYGLSPSSLMAVRGPSLGPGWSEFVNFEREWGEEFRRYFDPGKKTMDLWSLCRDQLVAAGLKEERIFSLDLCTRSLDTFFSYRRDRECGRQASLIWIA